VVTILGISCFYHDASAVLLRDGQVVAACAEERFSRVKHDPGYPANAVAYCCSAAGVAARDIDHVIFYEKPFLKFERIILTILHTFPRSCLSFRHSMAAWLTEKLWIRQILREKTGVPEKSIVFCEHHQSHAASAFLCSPYRDAAILTVDGVGEWATTTFGYGRDNTVTIDRELQFPHSLGLLYSTFTAFLGFEVNEGEYKVMGMAPYGTPRYVDRIEKLVTVRDDGSFELDMRYFAYHYSHRRSFSNRFAREFGPPRDPSRADTFDQYYADIAASIQRVTENVVVKLCHALYKLHPVPRLCLAGGVALNCVANDKILARTPFTELFVQPSAGDGGGALGAALYFHHQVLGNPRDYVMRTAGLGSEFSDKDIRGVLDARQIACRIFEDPQELFGATAAHLAAGKVIGWFQGRAEWGPRALGNRSILADPRDPAMKEIVNSKVKFRELFRPFAPAVLAEKAGEYFELSGSPDLLLYEFMLSTALVKEAKKNVIPAVTHVDGTARVQLVRPGPHPLLHGLLKAFNEQTGVPVLLNTSFNLKGEPIVNSPEDALSTFNRSGIDVLVMGSQMIEKEQKS
jgi:carbamoyltransferase